MKMKATEDRMRALGLLTPMSVLTLDDWEIPRDRVVINRKLGQGAFGTVCGGEAFFDERGWVSKDSAGKPNAFFPQLILIKSRAKDFYLNINLYCIHFTILTCSCFSLS